MRATVRCIGCGATVPDVDGPTHRYMLSAPGCWQHYAELTASPVPRTQLTVDAYAVQHPGVPTPQASQSVCLHLLDLCRILVRGGLPAEGPRFLSGLAHRTYPWLPPPPADYAVTVVDLVAVGASPAFSEIEMQFAQETWAAWAQHHGRIGRWLDDPTTLPGWR